MTFHMTCIPSPVLLARHGLYCCSSSLACSSLRNSPESAPLPLTRLVSARMLGLTLARPARVARLSVRPLSVATSTAQAAAGFAPPPHQRRPLRRLETSLGGCRPTTRATRSFTSTSARDALIPLVVTREVRTGLCPPPPTRLRVLTVQNARIGPPGPRFAPCCIGSPGANESRTVSLGAAVHPPTMGPPEGLTTRRDPPPPQTRAQCTPDCCRSASSF